MPEQRQSMQPTEWLVYWAVPVLYYSRLGDKPGYTTCQDYYLSAYRGVQEMKEQLWGTAR